MSSAYLDHNIHEERRRLRLQSATLEELGVAALAEIPVAVGSRAVDVACGAMGMLGALSRKVGPSGSVVGTDISEEMLDHARGYCREAGLTNVELVRDDAYASALPKSSFDLVHARFLLAPIGRDDVLLPQLEALVRPGGYVLLQEPDAAHWRVHPASEAHARLVEMIERAYERHMGGFNAGLRLLDLARSRGWANVGLSARVVGLPPGHPYLRAPVMFATALRAALLRDTPEAELDAAVSEAEDDYRDEGRFGTTFAVIGVWGTPQPAAGDTA
jgi:SAM-dependent methyltransferase